MKIKIVVFVLAGILGLTMVSLLGCFEKEKTQGKKNEEVTQTETTTAGRLKPTQPAEEKTIKVTLYFSDSEAEYLRPEVRSVSQTEGPAKTALLELIKGPETKGLRPTIPSGTKLISITIKDKIAYVNFSRELVENHPGGSAGETMTVYSVVDTLTEFPSIQRVKFLVQGKSIETLAGHLELTEPLSRNEDIIKR